MDDEIDERKRRRRRRRWRREAQVIMKHCDRSEHGGHREYPSQQSLSEIANRHFSQSFPASSPQTRENHANLFQAEITGDRFDE